VVERADLSSKTVANHLTLMVSLLRLAHELGWIVRVPSIRKPRTPLFTRDFRYLRTEEEVARFLRAARDEGDFVFALYATAVYTGLRAGKLAGLRREDIDLERRLITVQRSFDGPTKSGDVRYVPILDPLLPVLRAWLLMCPGQVVFPNEAGRMHSPSAYVFQASTPNILSSFVEAVGLSDEDRKHLVEVRCLSEDFVDGRLASGTVERVLFALARFATETGCPLVFVPTIVNIPGARYVGG